MVIAVELAPEDSFSSSATMVICWRIEAESDGLPSSVTETQI